MSDVRDILREVYAGTFGDLENDSDCLDKATDEALRAALIEKVRGLELAEGAGHNEFICPFGTYAEMEDGKWIFTAYDWGYDGITGALQDYRRRAAVMLGLSDEDVAEVMK